MGGGCGAPSGQASFEGQLPVLLHPGLQHGAQAACELGTQKAIFPGDQGCTAPTGFLAFPEGSLSSEAS